MLHKFASTWAAQTQSRPHTCSEQYCILPMIFASTHMYTSIHNSFVSKMCKQNITNILVFFYSRMLKFARNSRKLMHCEYYHFYSMSSSVIFFFMHLIIMIKLIQSKITCAMCTDVLWEVKENKPIDILSVPRRGNVYIFKCNLYYVNHIMQIVTSEVAVINNT